MKIVEKKLADIRPYDNNPRLNDAAVPAVAESLKKFGWQQPIVIDRKGVIVCGHTRYKAALELGMKTVPCKYADELTDEEITAYRLADNKTAELSEWDAEKMNEELAKIASFDISAFGFEPFLEKEEPEEVIDDEYVEQADQIQARAKAGDLFQLGDHFLICGDSTKKRTLESLMQQTQADLLITDPPYNVDYSAKSEVLTKAGYYSNPDTIATATRPIANDNMDSDSFVEFLRKAFGCAATMMKPGGGILYIP